MVQAKGKLFIVSTPIGNLGDMTYRAVEILKNVPMIAAEDTRHSRKLLSHYDISTPLISYFEHNRFTRIPKIINHLKDESLLSLKLKFVNKEKIEQNVSPKDLLQKKLFLKLLAKKIN